jgi:hypothetical protein
LHPKFDITREISSKKLVGEGLKLSDVSVNRSFKPSQAHTKIPSRHGETKIPEPAGEPLQESRIFACIPPLEGAEKTFLDI